MLHASYLLLQLSVLYKYKPTIDVNGYVETANLFHVVKWTMSFILANIAIIIAEVIGSIIWDYHIIEIEIMPPAVIVQISWVLAGWVWSVCRPLQEEATLIRKLIK